MLSLCEWQVQSDKWSVLQDNEDNDMIAIVKATGEIVDVYNCGSPTYRDSVAVNSVVVYKVK